MDKFMIIGERIHCISPAIRKAIEEKNLEPIFHRAQEQIEAGAHYIDVNIGPAERNGEEVMTWMVQSIQQKFNNIPFTFWVELNDNKSHKILKFEFYNCRIENIGDIELDTTNPETEITMDLSLKFDYFKIV